MNAVALIVRHLELNSFEFRTGSIVAGFFSSKDRQTNLNIFSYQSTPAHRHTEELQATQGDEKRYEWLTFVLSGRKAVAPVSYGIDEHGIGEPLQMYHRIALDTESEIFQKDTVFHYDGHAELRTIPYYVGFFWILIIAPVIILVTMAMMFRSVTKIEKQVQRYGVIWHLVTQDHGYWFGLLSLFRLFS
jgi:hypothetical protein